MAIIWNMTTPSVSKTVEQKELLCIAGGNAEWHSYFERQFGGFLESKQSCHRASRYVLKWVENLRPHTNLHMNVYNSFILIAKNWQGVLWRVNR